MILHLHGDLTGLVDRVELQGAVRQVVRVRVVGLFLELLHHQDRLCITPVGLAGRAAAELVVDVEVRPAAVREQHALDVELRRPCERALMLGIAVRDRIVLLVHHLEELGDVVDLLPGRVLGELQPVAVVRLEVLRHFLEEILPVERARHRGVIGQRHQPVAGIVVAAGIEEVVEPRLGAVAVLVLRQRVVADELRHVGIELGERGTDRLVLHVVQLEVGAAAAQVDADLLLHDRQVVRQDFHVDAGEVVEGLEVVADGEGRRRVLRHEDELGAGELLPLRVVGRLGLDARRDDGRATADDEATGTQARDQSTTTLQEFTTADAAPPDGAVDRTKHRFSPQYCLLCRRIRRRPVRVFPAGPLGTSRAGRKSGPLGTFPSWTISAAPRLHGMGRTCDRHGP